MDGGGERRVDAGSLVGRRLPGVTLDATDAARVDCCRLDGVNILVCQPDLPCEPAGDGTPSGLAPWNCTAQSLAYRDWYLRILRAGADRIIGLSRRSIAHLSERRARHDLPFHFLSDKQGLLADQLGLPQFVHSQTSVLLRRTLIIRAGCVTDVLDPCANPARDAPTVFRHIVAGTRPSSQLTGRLSDL